MLIFWLIIAVMTLIATGFLVVPWLLADANIATGRDAKNYAMALFLLLALPLLSISLYLKYGASQSIVAQQQNALVSAEIKKLGSLENIIFVLRQKVLAKPDSEGWILLGRLYFKNQQFKAASEAFAEANRLKPQQADTLVAYAESLYFAHHWVLTPQAKRLLDRALHLRPDHPGAINLLAMAAYQRGDYVIATQYWERLLPQLLPGSEAQQKLLEMMAKAQLKAN